MLATATSCPERRPLLTEALDTRSRRSTSLRELAHGILPAALTQGGLHAGVNSLTLRMPVPVDTDVSVGRLPAPIEAAPYFVVAEARRGVHPPPRRIILDA
jgi:hypothetical protein